MGPVHRYLVTATMEQRMDMWATGTFANWIETRERNGRETTIVTCFDEHAEHFLAVARAAGVTVEEVHGAGESETYELLIGEPGTGWVEAST